MNWIENCGRIELGPDFHSKLWVLCLDEGGDIWESTKKHKTLDQTLDALEDFLENGYEY